MKRDGPITRRSNAAPGRVGVLGGSYPGGKSGAGVFQRLINLIPRHRILISAFAGHCGIVRNIKPAEHTIVIDADPVVCEWWNNWRRSPKGRALEIHNCDSIEWMRYRLGATKYSASGSGVVRSHGIAGETFLFCDPPYVLSERSHGKTYAHELTDDCHRRLLEVLTRIPSSTAAVMLCGYQSDLYARLNWRSIDHRVPTRGGLQDERIWMNYRDAIQQHDLSHIGKDRRDRERIRRRQRNWRKQLAKMKPLEREAMLAELNSVDE